ncbi:MAG: hypothetical protein CMF96_03680 [Candidatus Marinimicrobia bacterium]|nr:hypothetical protein [Candidatus Neomarinimicrobiota bacterium]|tara:strand:- start:7068 stop:8258 length:1191 start_codon:yes stop_codon:yes gene_type:complete
MAITLILIFTLKTNFWFSEMFYNIGIPYLRYQKLWFFLLPGFYILILAYQNRNLKFKNTLIFITFFITHYFMEQYAYGNSYQPSTPIDLLNRWLYIFLPFIFFINAGPKYLYFILKTTITLLLINLILIYSDLLGLLNVSNISIGEGVWENRLESSQNLNTVNDMGVFALFILFWLKLKGEPYKFFNKKLPYYIYVILIAPLIFFQSSRGSFILLILIAVFYFKSIWENFKISSKILLILSFPLLIISQNYILNILSEVNVINRLIETPFSEESGKVGRVYQIIATWEVFQNSPFIGVGYQNATGNIFYGILRSNFQYTQILASGGVVLFLLYFYMVFKFFGKSLRSIRNNLPVLSILSFVLVLFIFRRPEPYLAVMAYATYVFDINYRNGTIIEK